MFFYRDFVLKVYGWFCLGRPGFWTFELFGRSWFLDVLDIQVFDVWAPFRSATAANPKSTIRIGPIIFYPSPSSINYSFLYKWYFILQDIFLLLKSAFLC